MQENLILIGMPASGKSTVEVILAKVLGKDFADTDLLIQKQEGVRLETIIADRGQQGFMAVEEQVCCGAAFENCVIATGGSVVYSERAMRHLKSLGKVIYLQVPFEDLKKRLHNIRQRGVVLREGQTLRELYDERVPLYEKYADLTVDESGGGIEETVTRLIEKLN